MFLVVCKVCVHVLLIILKGWFLDQYALLGNS